ncbi:hypothetical protein Ancab_011177 [Ancistrocladus abbreviatus]
MLSDQKQQTAQAPPKIFNILTAIIMALLALIVIVGLVILVIWLVIKPKKLVYSIDEGSIKGYTLSNDHLDSTFNLVVRAYNPNHRVSVSYDRMEVAVSYGGQTVAYQEVAPFFQPHKNITRLRVDPTARYVALPAKTAQDLRLERTAGQVELDVRMKAKIRFKVGVWKSRHYKLKVLCSPVMINFNSPDKFQMTNCEVDI